MGEPSSHRESTRIGTLRYYLMCIISRTDPENGWANEPIARRDALACWEILDNAQVFGSGEDRELLIPDPPDEP